MDNQISVGAIGQQLRIAILSVHSSPLGQPGVGDTGGMSIYIRELTRELARAGHTVDIYSRVQDQVSPGIVPLSPRARQIHIHAGEAMDLDKLLVYAHVPDFACQVEAFRKSHDLHYDLIYSNYWISGMAGRFLQAYWQVPHMIMFHTLGAIKNSLGLGEDEPELRLAAEGQLALECDRVIASTEFEKSFLADNYRIPPAQVEVVPCGVNMDQFKPSDKSAARDRLELSQSRIVLFVGRLERLKGIDRLVRAVASLEDPGVKLVVVGEDGNRRGEADNLRALASELGLAGRVDFRGLINYEDLPDYYSAADVVAFPSFYESFGLVPLESLACGTPVVATPVGDLRSIIVPGRTGIVIDDNRPENLVAGLSKVLYAPPGTFSQTPIRDSVARFDWKNIAERIASVCHELLSLRPIRA